MKRQAVFLDHVGTLNVEKNYVYRIEDWEWISGALEAILGINRMGFHAIVVANQSGVARGYYGDAAVITLHQEVDELLAEAGAHIDADYFCPHHPEYGSVHNCACRKPKAGLLMQAKNDFDVDFARSWINGDRLSDMRAGFCAGARPILVQTGYGANERLRVPFSLRCEANVLAAVRSIECSWSRP